MDQDNRNRVRPGGAEEWKQSRLPRAAGNGKQSKRSSEELKRIYLFKLLALLMFAGAIVMFTTIAWFGMNKDVETSGMAVRSEKPETLFDATVYRYVKQQNERFQLNSFVSNNSAHLTPQLTLNEYDVIFTDNNVYTPVILRLGLTGGRLPQSGTVTVRIVRSEDPLIVNGNLQPYFTAVTNYVCDIDGTYYSNDISTLYNNALSGMEDLTASKFISSNDVTTDNLTFTLSYTPSDFNGNVLNVYILIRYEESYANRLVRESLDNSTELITNFVMTNDISVITVDHTE